MNAAKAYKIPGLMQIPIWAYAIVIMFGVSYAIQKMGMGVLPDNKSKSRIAGVASDYAITAAIVSMPVRAIMQYIVPILTMVIVGYIFIFYLCKRLFDDCQFERGIAIWGSASGVFLTGLMLLKICAPDYELPALNDYSVGFSFTSVTSFVLLPISVNFLLHASFGSTFLYSLCRSLDFSPQHSIV